MQRCLQVMAGVAESTQARGQNDSPLKAGQGLQTKNASVRDASAAVDALSALHELLDHEHLNTTGAGENKSPTFCRAHHSNQK